MKKEYSACKFYTYLL